jgi:hypothetical protein
VPLPDDKGAVLRFGQPVATGGPGPFRRILFAAIGLLAGDAALLLILSPSFVIASGVFWVYVIVSAVGWTLIGLPFALLVPARVVSHLPWPLRILAGVVLGPLALLLMVVLLLAKQGRLREFSLAHSESLWPMSILVSTVAFLVYAALLRRREVRSGR